MEGQYTLTSEQEANLLEMSSVIEDVVYLFSGGNIPYSAKAGKSATCNCRSSRSSGGTCRASSLELEVK